MTNTQLVSVYVQPLPPDNSTTLEDLTEGIHFYLRQMGQNIIEIGKRLILAKAKLSHGEWQSWLVDNFDLKYRMAANFMAVAERFSKVHSNALLSQTQMVVLLALPEGEEEKFIAVKAAEGNPVDKMSVKKLREEIKKYKATLVEDILVKEPVGNSLVESSGTVSFDKTKFECTFEPLQNVESVSGSEPLVEVNSSIETDTVVFSDTVGAEVSVSQSMDDNVTVVTTSNELVQLLDRIQTLMKDDNFQRLLKNGAVGDVSVLEDKLQRLAEFYGRLQGCLSIWKSRQEEFGVDLCGEENSDEENERRAVISALYQIALTDNKRCMKSARIRKLIQAAGYEVVHHVPTQVLVDILKEVSPSFKANST